MGVVGMLLAMTTVWLGTGWLDGFQVRSSTWLIGHFSLYGLGWLIVSAITGMLIYGFYWAAVNQQYAGWVGLFAVIRAFVLFPWLGAAMLFAGLGGVLWAAGEFVIERILRGPTELRTEPLVSQLLVVPVWVMALPFTLLKLESDGSVDIPQRVSPARLWKWFPALYLLLLLAPGMESEATGERVHPDWLAAMAGYWLADWLAIAFWVIPKLRTKVIGVGAK